MVKKIFVILLVSIIFCGSVSAESYFENENGVILTKPEYDYIVELYNENYPSIITIDEYNVLKDNNIFGQEIKRVSTDDNIVNPSISLLSGSSQFHETQSKRLEMGVACGSTCLVVSTLEWKKLPSTRSYDLFGGMQVGSTKPDTVTSHMYLNGRTSTPVEYIKNNIGASATYRLPNDTAIESLAFDLSFTVSEKGRVTTSYQHAKKNITLANSRKFIFNYNGYGNVFLFDQGIRSYYDQMCGLDIVL